MLRLLLLVSICSSIKIEYNECKDPQIIKGSTNIYIEDLSQRTVYNSRKGVFIQITPESSALGFSFHTMEDTYQVVGIQEVTDCTTFSEVMLLPKPLVVEVGQSKTYFVSLADTEVTEYVVIAEKMLVSASKTEPIVIRQEFLPLTFDIHTYTEANTIYYSVLGRTNWKVAVEIDGTQITTVDMKQDQRTLLTVMKEAGIYRLTLKLADEEKSSPLPIVVDETAPAVINAVFRTESAQEESICYEGKHQIVQYKSTANGVLQIDVVSDPLGFETFVNTNNKCSIYSNETEVHGDFVIVLKSNSKIYQDSTVVIKTTLKQAVQPIIDPSEEPGMDKDLMITIIVFSIAVFLLIVINIGLIGFIIYSKKVKKDHYRSL
uniref:Uncharacterized protein n=1 Tax=Entamoeba invadens TaxID=33085 RepID=S0B1S9_ENTIV|nr:hypothetical protein [Entamoeba invadens]